MSVPLGVYADNPIWFSWQGKAVFLAGSHTWACLQERGVVGETPDFDYDEYLAFMVAHGHNFLRLWVWEHAQWMQFVGHDVPIRYEPLPWARTGPGLARDGKPKFDLTQFDERFFRRLRDRVVGAGERGIFVAVMLFQGFSVEQKGTQGVDPAKGNAWEGHPFHRDNNVNGVDGDDDADGEGRDVHTLVQPAVTRLQEAYVAKVIDTLGDLDHIVWEIGNECHPESVEWHGHMIGFIRKCERSRPKQHLIGMTSSPIRNPPLFASDADWISPMGRQYLEDPPRAEGRKLIVVDTDHILPWAYEPTWVWRNLCRGNHFILMDGYRDFRMGSPETPIAAAEPARRAMGQAVRLAERMDLGRMVPRPDLASSTYCLAAPGREYLVYLPDGGDVEIDLGGQEGMVFEGEWYEPTTETRRELATTGGVVRLATPFAGESLLWLRARA